MNKNYNYTNKNNEKNNYGSVDYSYTPGKVPPLSLDSNQESMSADSSVRTETYSELERRLLGSGARVQMVSSQELTLH